MAETLYRDRDDFTACYDFPAEHWFHLHTSNAIESVFAGCAFGGTSPSERMSARRRSTSCSRIVERLGRHWRVLNGGATVMTLVLAGERFVEGILVKRSPEAEVQAA